MTALQIIQFRWPESGKKNDVTKSDDATMELAVATSGHDEEIASINEDKGDDRNDNASDDDSKKLKRKRVDDDPKTNASHPESKNTNDQDIVRIENDVENMDNNSNDNLKGYVIVDNTDDKEIAAAADNVIVNAK